MPATIGSAASADSDDNATAPTNAPIPPGTASRETTFQSTLPKRQCAVPDASVVAISARCTLAEAAGGRDADREQQRRRADAVGHAERTVDQLREEADDREGEELEHPDAYPPC